MHFLYIIYSTRLNEYYTGETVDTDIRLDQHNTGFFHAAYTSKTNDWEIVLKLQFDSINNARKAEAFIKKMKSRKFIESLINDSDWLVQRFNLPEGHCPEASGRTQ
jgi:putative endonuclease